MVGKLDAWQVNLGQYITALIGMAATNQVMHLDWSLSQHRLDLNPPLLCVGARTHPFDHNDALRGGLRLRCRQRPRTTNKLAWQHTLLRCLTVGHMHSLWLTQTFLYFSHAHTQTPCRRSLIVCFCSTKKMKYDEFGSNGGTKVSIDNSCWLLRQGFICS